MDNGHGAGIAVMPSARFIDGDAPIIATIEPAGATG
jgi:hypothetical protein